MFNEMTYRVLETTSLRTSKLINYIENVGDSDLSTTLFLTFGRDKPWSTRENEPNYVPPYPTESLEYIGTVWRDILGFLKIRREWIDAVYPRKDWGDVEYADSRTFNIGDIVVANNNSYNRTDDEIGWTVYKLIDVPVEGACSIDGIYNKGECMLEGGTWTPSHESTKPPQGRGNAETVGTFDDGYVWEYLYTIPLDVAVNRCTNEYIVVPLPNLLKANPERWGYEDHITQEHNDYDLVYRMGVTKIMFKAYLDSVYFPETALPNRSNSFRQISIIQNPLLRKNSVHDKDKKATGNYYKPDDMMRGSGQMQLIQNSPPIKRSLDQTEEITIIFDF